MKDVAKHPRVHKRKGSDNYYFRAKVPMELREAFGKAEVCFSLKTSSYKQALERVRVESLKFDLECAEVRRRLASQPREIVDALSDVEVSRLMAIWQHQTLEADEEGRVSGSVRRQHDVLDEVLYFALEDYRVQLATSDLNAVEQELDSLLEAQGLKVKKGSEAYNQLAYALLKERVRVFEALNKRHQGHAIDTPPRPALLPSSAAQGISQGNGPTITQIHEMWAEEHIRTGGPEKTARDFGIYVRRFAELHGDLPVQEITKAHVRDFKDAMLRFPVMQGPAFRGLTVPQILEQVAKNPAEFKLLSPRTVNDRLLGAIGAVLGWAEENGYIDHNPASRVKVKAAKVAKTARLPYSVDDLNTIFRFPIYTDGARPAGGAGEAAKWLPLLAAFTGARLEELGQLSTSDIKEERGVFFFDMTTMDEGKRRKTESSKRRVPLHSKLIDLGFLAYAEQVAKAGHDRLFPDLKASGPKLTESWSKWWGRYARQHGGFDKLKVFHSFRHSFKDALREGGVQEEVSDAITGHAPTTEGRKYGGNAYPLNRLKDGIEMLSYPGLDLGHLTQR